MIEPTRGGGGAGSDLGGVGGGGVTDSESELPSTWLSLKLGDVLAYGKTEKAEPEEIAPETWVLELEDVEKDTTKVLQHLTFAERQSKSTKNKFNAGDVLYGKLRPYLNKVTFADRPGVCTTEIVPIKPNEAVHGRYLFHWLRHPAFLTYVTEVSHGVNMPRLGTDAGRDAPFVLAPKAEQKRIADKLDTVLTRVDAVNTRLARVAPLLKRFRQSVLAAATSGRLTEDWREIRETAPWTDKRIEDVAKVFLGRQRSPVNHEGPFMRRYVRAANVTWSGWDLSDVKEMNFDADDFERYRLQKNDILLNEGSGSADEVGKPAIWNEEIPDCCFQNTLICVRPETVDAKFMFLVLLHAALTKRFVDSTRGVNIHHIGKQNMARFPVAVPNADEQTEIVRRVETLFAFADRLEARLAQAQTAATRLTPALLAKAFRGELVPQDPNDEPAAELLRRLQAERATAPKASAGRGRKAAVQS